jgi:hypothetical protein
MLSIQSDDVILQNKIITVNQEPHYSTFGNTAIIKLTRLFYAMINFSEKCDSF